MKIVMKKGFEDLVPHYATSGSAGADLKAAIDEPITINPGERKLVSSGMSAEVPKDYMMHVTPRSGLAIKNGISIVNSPGIVDSDYRGEIGVILINHGNEPFTINRGERIAQITIVKVEQVDFEITEKLEDTERGDGGFGHTGK